MKVNRIKVKDINDGDIIWFDLDDSDMEEGKDVLITGADVLHIVDDSSMAYKGCFLTNGGFEINIEMDAVVFKIGHYSELVKQID